MNNKNTELLPLGSIVYLQEGTQKLMIIGRGVIFDDEETGEKAFADYMGVLYPMGFQTESTLFFQHENIDKVVFCRLFRWGRGTFFRSLWEVDENTHGS